MGPLVVVEPEIRVQFPFGLTNVGVKFAIHSAEAERCWLNFPYTFHIPSEA